jgi:uncharacterized protein (DUF2147 family)
MKRLYSLATLMLLTTSAHAGTMYSFEVAGRTIHINAPSGCASLECISVSGPGDRDAGPRRVSSAKSVGKNFPHLQSRQPDQTAEQHSPASPKSPSSAQSPSSPKQASVSPPKTEAASTQVLAPTPPIVAASPAAARTETSLATTAQAIPTSSPSTTTLADTKFSGLASPTATNEAPSRPRPALAAGFDTPVAVLAPKPTKNAASSDAITPALSYYAAAPLPPPASASYAKVSDQPEKQLKASPSTGATPLPSTAPSFAAPATSSPATSPVDIKSAIAPIAAAIGSLIKQTGSQSASGSSTDPSNGLLSAPGQPTKSVVGSATQPVSQSNFGPAATQIPFAPSDASNVAPDSTKKASSDRDRSASPLGNWRADANKPSIRIKPCGPNLCGYASNLSSNQTEEKMLIDLKPISSTEWVGMILNQDTKITYPTIVMLEGDNSLRVRSCGLSAAFCAGQVWSREVPVLAAR